MPVFLNVIINEVEIPLNIPKSIILGNIKLSSGICVIDRFIIKNKTVLIILANKHLEKILKNDFI
ncbi:hypothetical protein FACS189462_0610 [Spirochaetia bacterium]|nr:hypothetical protein FACS189462_0610 [Spirochaetia bacterium]